MRPVFRKAADFNRDNRLDVAVSDSDGNAVWVLQGNGSGGFGTPTAFPAGMNLRDIAVADLNHDNLLDIAVTNTFSNAVSILRGNGDGTFAAPQSIAMSRGPNSVSVADLNNDGNLDLATGTNFPASLSVLPGDGSGGFGPPANFAAGSFPRSVAIADYNSDGSPDMASANAGSDNVSVLINNCHIAGTTTATPVNTTTPVNTATPTATNPGATGVPTNTAVASVTVPPSASRTATVTASSTRQATAVASASATAPATLTATVCALTFTDVPPQHTFYPFVRCLACRGIVNGYPDGTFKPNNPVTRGQLAKIVSQSAGFNEPVSGQTFDDVVPDSTFYEYIERLASRQVMGGYVCGVDPAEPCGAENRPYFRPNAGATRGQLTKIVSNAAGFSDTIPDTQYQFADVEPGSTFWLYVERLLLNRPGVMSGYSCGGPGEPCDSESRPYFRPNNPLTRGQTAKIVTNTFLPGCNEAQ
jgi:hypothetical protein